MSIYLHPVLRNVHELVAIFDIVYFALFQLFFFPGINSHTCCGCVILMMTSEVWFLFYTIRTMSFVHITRPHTTHPQHLSLPLSTLHTKEPLPLYLSLSPHLTRNFLLPPFGF